MKVLFHTTEMNLRGTAVAVLDYARYNQEILGNESVISYCADAQSGNGDGGNEQSVIEKARSICEVRQVYNSQFNPVCSGIDVAYYLRSGYIEPEAPLPDVRTAVHVIFQFHQPHGDRYAYISEWLSNRMTGGTCPHVHHIVQLPDPTADFRQQLGIPADKIVIGRHGGKSTFDIPYAHQAVAEILRNNTDYVFVFLNTNRFIEHPNVIYLDPITDPQTKSNYINMCDAFVQAKTAGESFGLAPCESLYFNKPTFCFNGGYDQFHVDYLQSTGMLYNNAQELVERLYNYRSFDKNYHDIVERFNPATVMNKFKQVFLD